MGVSSLLLASLLAAASCALLLGGEARSLPLQLPTAPQGGVAEGADGSWRPWFCRGLDCPDFEVLETSGTLQLRRYPKQRFLVTKVENSGGILQAQLVASKRFADYLAGANEDGAKLPPTVPLNTVLLTADGEARTVKGTIFFAIYLPREVQDDAPRPDSRDVCVVRLPRRAVWVQTFDSPVLSEGGVIDRGWSLLDRLHYDLGRKVDRRAFVFSLYEPPLPLLPHHYEVAVRARCRRRGDTGAGGGGAGAGGAAQDDDDYPLPEAGGGDAQDDECDEDDGGGGGGDLVQAIQAAFEMAA